MDLQTLYKPETDQSLHDSLAVAETVFHTADLDTWWSLSTKAGQPGETGALESILNAATEMLSQYSIRYPDFSLETSAVLDTLAVRTSDSANTPAPAQRKQIAVVRAVSNALQHMRVDLAGKISTLFELELAAQVCRDLSETPGWGQKVLIPGTGEFQEHCWSVAQYETLVDTIQGAIPRIVKRQVDRTLDKVLRTWWSGFPQQTQYENEKFGRIWSNPQRIGDWIVLKSRAERIEAVSILLKTCRSFLCDVAQGSFEAALQPGAPYHINVAWRNHTADGMTKYEKLGETECTLLIPLAAEWFKLCGQ